MKILYVVNWFFPAKHSGGPAVSIDNICTLLKDDVENYIVTVDHDINNRARFSDIKEGWNERNNCYALYLEEEEINYKKLLNVTRSINPDIIYLNSLFGYKFTVPFLKIATKENIPLILAPRGELCKNAFKKKYKKKPYLLLLSTYLKGPRIYYQSTSREETLAIRNLLGVGLDKIYELPNIPTIINKVSMKKKKIPGTLNCVFLSRIQEIKNLLGAIRILGKVSGNIKFDIYGPIENTRYWNQCKNEIKKLPSNIEVYYKGVVGRSDVSMTFSLYDVFLFPTFSENYGHVIVEALLSQCLIVISDQTPWTDINNNGGWALPLEDDGEFVEILNKIVNMNEEEYSYHVKLSDTYIKNKININEFKEQYLSVYKEIML